MIQYMLQYFFFKREYFRKGLRHPPRTVNTIYAGINPSCISFLFFLKSPNQMLRFIDLQPTITTGVLQIAGCKRDGFLHASMQLLHV
ncbi:MAG: hypothetical protein AA908_10925 [Chlorobi bacterium NICIL-2]|nr:MAG: hypothetical protein AA908_10925 [Chlorobi bacterium NICIL-2]